ncbi:MAG: type II toxin-antitoxin system HicB family antitoxin [Clostridia bacterium]|nr:type II toxin-antitoxin system HicB family antitoxin [Clostridia bacterium]
MKKDRYAYVAIFSYEEDGISIEFPDLPGCYPCADKNDTAGAIANAKEALGLHLWGMEQDEEEIPAATPITKLTLEAHQVPFLVEVFMPPVRERINSKFVKKTLSLPAWLAAKADEEGVNCSKIFQNALMEYLHLEPPKGLIKNQ